MRSKLLSLFFLIIICSSSVGSASGSSQRVIVAGKILNYDSEIPLTLVLNRVGINSEQADLKIDNDGNFHTVFKTYTPIDAWISYRTNFLIQLNPNDSLYVVFDGSFRDRPGVLSSIQFGGNDATTNRFIAKFQQMYYSNEVYSNWDRKAQAIKEYEPDEYIKYNDSILQKTKMIYEDFVKTYSPNEKSRNWAFFFSEKDYYDNIAHYAGDHRNANDFGWDNLWTVPGNFYEKLKNRLPLDSLSLMSSYALNSYAERFSKYAMGKLLAEREESADWNILPSGGLMALSTSYDSISLNAIVKYVPDVLLKEIMLTSFFQKRFDKKDIASYEKYKKLIDNHIQHDFLKEPLYQNYLHTKNRIDYPELFTEAVLKEAEQSTVKDIFDEILSVNEGKVIYIDFWATWCGPCLAEMPNSKQVEKEMKGKEVSFVYICIQSEKEKYLATLSEYQLGGQHYFLSKKQSKDILKLFEIQGIPFYTLIDQNGVIIEKGNHLRPLQTKEKIEDIIRRIYPYK